MFNNRAGQPAQQGGENRGLKDEKELNGFIVLHRQILNWEWYDDINTKAVFLHLLLSANFKNTTWHGVKLKRGELVTSVRSLSKVLRLSERSVRTALNHLKSTQEVTTRTTQRFTVITVVNYSKYQDKGETPTQQTTQSLTNDRHTNDTLTTHYRQQRNNDNNVNNDNNTRESAPAPVYFFGFYENVKLTEIEMEKFQTEYPKQWEATLERLSSYLAETGKTYSSHFAKLRAWAKEDSEKVKAEPKPEGPKYRILE